MLLGRRAPNVNWQFLGPNSSRGPQKGLSGSPKVQLPHTTKPWVAPRSPLRPVNLQPQRCAHKLFHVGQRVRDQARDQSLARDLDITSVYQELRRVSLRSDYNYVRDFVKVLVKERGQQPNLRLYDALLLANMDNQDGSAGEVARLLDELAAVGLTPDSGTYHAALRVLAIHPDYLLRQRVLEELRQRWFSLTKEGWHDVVVGLIRDRHLEFALDNLDQMRKESIKIESWLYDLVVYSLCSAGEFDSALDLLQHRISSGEAHISANLWYYLLDTASRTLHHRATLFAYKRRVETSYLNPPDGICINILSTAARHGDIYLATSVLRVLGRRSGKPIQLHHYEALLETYMTVKDIRTSFTLLTIMSAAGRPPTEASTRSIFSHLSESPALAARAASILKELHEQDRQIPIQAVNVIMEAYIFHRDLDSALSIYKTLHQFGDSLKPNTATFNLLFRGCSQSARKDLAMFLASEMAALKVAPDRLTYDRLVLVCLNSENNIDDAWRYFKEMRDLGWWCRDGTIMALARRACSKRDMRVWTLLGDEQGKGLPKSKIESLVEAYWKHGPREPRNEVNVEQREGH